MQSLLLIVGVLLFSCVDAINIYVLPEGGNDTSPLQYGLMFEDINHAGDGGLYAELIRNRAFQGSTVYPANLDGYEPVNGAVLSLKNLSNPLSSSMPSSLNVAKGVQNGIIGFANTGWWGIEVKPHNYAGSFYVKGDYDGDFSVSLQSITTGDVLATARVKARCGVHDWTEHRYNLRPTRQASDTNNTLSITFDTKDLKDESLDFNLISLFPPTWNNRPNGLRIDLVEALSELDAKFLRFPGGSDIEGLLSPYWYKWNETVGPLKDRMSRPSAWGYEESNGIGLIEYMNWCDDLGLEPILAVWDGHYLSGEVINEADLQPYIEDTLNQLEFLMGSVETTYGSWRASLGYPKPWKINYVEIGNEDNLYGGLDTYIAYRFKAYFDAITAKYPDITVMESLTGMPSPQRAASDYHQYTTPDGFVSQFSYFDQFPIDNRTLNGEVATVYPNNPSNSVAWGSPFPLYPWWIGSVAEAVFLIGEERNSPKIIGASYAPTFRNINSWAWSPTLIAFDADSSHTSLSTSWHVIKLLSRNRIAHNLPTTSSEGGIGPIYWVAGQGDKPESYLFKAAVYNSTGDMSVAVTFSGSRAKSATLTVLSSQDPNASNYPGGPEVVQTNVSSVVAKSEGVFQFTLPNLSVAVLTTE
ncbi:alpha-L-arabinofuranosidase A [Talaromyces stipitatus ATCC 10500]|uniref:non-reducing end alpha-L-arabinofuranosidase n=1 Tax=Talaromyces stipitatus (strain ATCC 10500 / CBS 375.48 / QM 6759 / NRRL 1006) TaxID=441959 RepID=B8MJ19_TALSN|nr:alpha-L-arabinofuranosidase A [Talaromyces stipitatus ATCC 10500]EED15681.1 alpha-L-arabinofuranosidase A [Talaromyces stipitatus ATCC 10500]